MDIIIRKPTEMNAPSTNAIVDAPQHLSFVTNATTEEHLKAASVTIEALSKNSDCGIVYFDEYGSDYVKKVGKELLVHVFKKLSMSWFFFPVYHVIWKKKTLMRASMTTILFSSL